MRRSLRDAVITEIILYRLRCYNMLSSALCGGAIVTARLEGRCAASSVSSVVSSVEPRPSSCVSRLPKGPDKISAISMSGSFLLSSGDPFRSRKSVSRTVAVQIALCPLRFFRTTPNMMRKKKYSTTARKKLA